MLKRIAEVLDESEDAFLDGGRSKRSLDQASELLRIWGGLEHAADRQKLLAFARTLATGRRPA